MLGTLLACKHAHGDIRHAAALCQGDILTHGPIKSCMGAILTGASGSALAVELLISGAFEPGQLLTRTCERVSEHRG